VGGVVFTVPFLQTTIFAGTTSRPGRARKTDGRWGKGAPLRLSLRNQKLRQLHREPDRAGSAAHSLRRPSDRPTFGHGRQQLSRVSCYPGDTDRVVERPLSRRSYATIDVCLLGSRFDTRMTAGRRHRRYVATAVGPRAGIGKRQLKGSVRTAVPVSLRRATHFLPA